ncbi:hypothetical protein AMECASPLE_001208 [Ameca splendens]|uniref:Uncharacterized protein n=1 Tax=Ameca splendens TaxID=208324 RepID=A0ABV0Z7B0_9TELE
MRRLFCGGDLLRVSELPCSQSCHRPIQWCFLELFVIFVYKREKKLFQNDLNECIFVYVHEKDAIQRSVKSSGEDGEVTVSDGLSVSFSVVFCVFIFNCFVITEPFTSYSTFSTNARREAVVRRSCRVQ